jgi:predicted RNase H-like HicB family nuclease
MHAINTLLTVKIIHEPEASDAPFVAYVPEFDISSCGTTQDEAIVHVKEALGITLEEAKKDGTISQVLAEAGFAASKRAPLSAQRSRIVIEPFVLG